MSDQDAVRAAIGFARTLRAAGVPATTDRADAFVEALATLDPARRADVYWAGRVTLCARREDLDRYDRAFRAYFDGHHPESPARRPPHVTRTVVRPVLTRTETAPGHEDEEAPLVADASRTEVLRTKDVAQLDESEREELRRLLGLLDMPGALRRTRRWQLSVRGRVDRAATMRALLRTGGEPARLVHRTHRLRPRPVVILADVSGSMGAYADALLRFAHAAARGSHARTEVFTVGTRLTRVTREISLREPDTAMAEVARTVPDWSGGTRLGERLKTFLDEWGQRGMARGAVVVVLSDGWEQADPALLGEQMARLGRLAHRVVWANPRKARPGYAPLVSGMAAALPHVDEFVEGHSLAALEQLARVVARGATPPPVRGAAVHAARWPAS